MPDLIDDSTGERLSVEDYVRDFDQRFADAEGHESWKLERKQHFRQPGNASWDAFSAGEWGKALQLIEGKREQLDELAKEDESRGITLFRVRVVAEPIVPYLQWELHSLRLRSECGERIRVVPPEQVAEFEDEEELPELLTVGDDTVYKILYDEDGVLEGAVRFIDRTTATRCADFIEKIYANGEELAEYFDRRVAPLDPPRVPT
ncbi:DUF6879 family protein [Amycolatopsis cihanbeyliensis]|uniref:DUF6879 domain-containing protein n=1 Tax=Amycolatopsis cihanbeyliensis TaxID=1128664 RepID=A0A542DS85_AMYCI|nr:DUF6879 family protein [Amycolatopsis cihanbeyliensis]TQJ05864.1 hypothetical protein FB471_5708 [Amycolatopsis cihanbeyliensis]